MRRADRLLPRALFTARKPGDDAAVAPAATRRRRAPRELAASYMAAGFVHGVLNSDNINVTGESFDYGPWRFAPTLGPGFTAAYFDHAGLYAFGRQPEAIHWDVVQLASALRLIAEVGAAGRRARDLPRDSTRRRSPTAMLLAAGRRRRAAPSRRSRADPGDRGGADRDRDTPIDRFFFDWLRRARARPDDLWRTPSQPCASSSPATSRASPLDHPYWSERRPCSMLIDEVEAIWARIARGDDWSAADAKVAAIRRMGEALASGLSVSRGGLARGFGARARYLSSGDARFRPYEPDRKCISTEPATGAVLWRGRSAMSTPKSPHARARLGRMGGAAARYRIEPLRRFANAVRGKQPTPSPT